MSSDIENTERHEFSIAKKGYNKEEVSKYIAELLSELQDCTNKVTELEFEVDELKTHLEEYQKIDRDLRNTMIFLKESERDTIIKTQDQIDLMIKEAEEKKDDIIFKAEEEAKSTRDTLLFLKEQKEILVTRLKIIIDSQEGMLRDLSKGENTLELQKTLAEAAAFKVQAELNIESILEKLL